MADSKDTKKSTSSKSSAKSETTGSEPDTSQVDTKRETEIKQQSATGGGEKSGLVGTPTQDDLNPAYAPPKEDGDDAKK